MTNPYSAIYGIKNYEADFPNGNTRDCILCEVDFTLPVDAYVTVNAVGKLLINDPTTTDPQMILHINVDNSAIPDSACLVSNGPFTIQNVFYLKAGPHKAYLLGFNERPFQVSGVTLAVHLAETGVV